MSRSGKARNQTAAIAEQAGVASRYFDAEPSQQQAQHHAPRIAQEDLRVPLPRKAHVQYPERERGGERGEQQMPGHGPAHDEGAHGQERQRDHGQAGGQSAMIVKGNPQKQPEAEAVTDCRRRPAKEGSHARRKLSCNRERRNRQPVGPHRRPGFQIATERVLQRPVRMPACPHAHQDLGNVGRRDAPFREQPDSTNPGR